LVCVEELDSPSSHEVRKEQLKTDSAQSPFLMSKKS